MKIAVLGATGQTGQHLVNQALQQGHSVTAVVRNPGKLTITHENLKVNSRLNIYVQIYYCYSFRNGMMKLQNSSFYFVTFVHEFLPGVSKAVDCKSTISDATKSFSNVIHDKLKLILHL